MKPRAILAAALIVAAASGSASAQGLFEMLFGPDRPAAQRSGPVVRYASREVGPVLRRAPNNETVGAEVQISSLDEMSRPLKRRYVEPEKPGPYIAPSVGKGPLGPFLNDPTLRAGDIVATEKGLMVYGGPGGSRHSERQFTSLEASKRFVGDKLPMLVKMDRELRRPTIVIAEQVQPITATLPTSRSSGIIKADLACREGFVCLGSRRASLDP